MSFAISSRRVVQEKLACGFTLQAMITEGSAALRGSAPGTLMYNWYYMLQWELARLLQQRS